MEKQETIADIIAEIRKIDCDEICPWWADGGSCDSCPLGGSGKNCSFSKFADRLEAAWKRGKAEIEADALAAGGLVEASRAIAEKSSVVGDAVKMREALKTVKRYFDGYTVNILELRRKVDAALAKPPRNCDRFATLEDAYKAHREICEEYGACNKACVYKSGHSGVYQCFEAWLFAPAMEQKGAVS